MRFTARYAALLLLFFSAAAQPPSLTPTATRLSLGARRALDRQAATTAGMAWARGLLALLIIPPLLMIAWHLWHDPGTPLVLRMLHARALELLGARAEDGEALARDLRNMARRARNRELEESAQGGQGRSE